MLICRRLGHPCTNCYGIEERLALAEMCGEHNFRNSSSIYSRPPMNNWWIRLEDRLQHKMLICGGREHW